MSLRSTIDSELIAKKWDKVRPLDGDRDGVSTCGTTQADDLRLRVWHAWPRSDSGPNYGAELVVRMFET